MEVSVIIPFYNSETTLDRAISSVLAQKNVHLQILLIDNNSTDDSHKIAKAYAEEYTNISLHKEPKQGANHARNLGLLLAKHDWIQYLDADDALLPMKIYHQIHLPNLDKVDVISSPIEEVTISNKKINYDVSDMGDLMLSLLSGKLGWTCSNLWRKSTLQELGGWNTHFSSQQEKELMFRLILAKKKFLFYNHAETIVYEQESSISSKPDTPLNNVKLLQIIENSLHSSGNLTAELDKVLQNEYYNKLLWSYKLDPLNTKELMPKIDLKFELIQRPWHHTLLTNILGLKNTFSLLRLLGKS